MWLSVISDWDANRSSISHCCDVIWNLGSSLRTCFVFTIPGTIQAAAQGRSGPMLLIWKFERVMTKSIYNFLLHIAYGGCSSLNTDHAPWWDLVKLTVICHKLDIASRPAQSSSWGGWFEMVGVHSGHCGTSYGMTETSPVFFRV
jgi:hypothetical protein